jgi:hypothetical protein
MLAAVGVTLILLYTWLFGSDADQVRLPRALLRAGRRPAR